MPRSCHDLGQDAKERGWGKKAIQVRKSNVPTLWKKVARVYHNFVDQAYLYKEVRAYLDRLTQGLCEESIDSSIKKAGHRPASLLKMSLFHRCFSNILLVKTNYLVSK